MWSSAPLKKHFQTNSIAGIPPLTPIKCPPGYTVVPISRPSTSAATAIEPKASAPSTMFTMTKCKLQKLTYEHGYSEPISSGREFQFFGAHLTSKSRMDMRVGAFDRYTLPICGKNTELVCKTSQFFFWDAKVENFVNFRYSRMANSRHF